jgi:myo-inositol 2-dehydrogenase/D-chiro-inositol 1-dehydrogenase
MAEKRIAAVVGAGRMGRLHCENIVRHIDGAAVRYLVHPGLGQDAMDWACALGIERPGVSMDEALADPEVDCVLICSPTATHAEYAVAAARAKKHIFCEKPIAESLSEIRRVQYCVAQSGVKFMLGFVRRFDERRAAVRRTIESGEAGSPLWIGIVSRDAAPPPEAYIQRSGGIFLDMMIHDFDLARYLMGSEIAEVYADGSVLTDEIFVRYGDVDTASVMLRFESGALGQIVNSRRTAYGYDQRLEVFCENGCLRDHDSLPAYTFGDAGEKSGQRLVYPRHQDAFVAELKHFFDAVAHGSAPCVQIEDGLRAATAALGAIRSLKERRPVGLFEPQNGDF